MSHLQNDLEARQAAHEREQQDAESAAGWQAILLKFPHVADHIANFKIVESYCEPLSVSLRSFEVLLDNPEFVNQLNLVAPSEQKAEYIRKILALLKGVRSEHSLANEGKRLQWFSLAELRQRLTDIEIKQQQNKLSVSELRQIVKPPAPTSPTVPAEITLAAIKAADADQIRSWNRRYGAQAINDRLFGRN